VTTYRQLIDLARELIVTINHLTQQKYLFLLGLLVGSSCQLDVKMVDDGRITVYFEKIKNIMEAR
jgi:hypothetical protein